jgi:hypothetical protein
MPSSRTRRVSPLVVAALLVVGAAAVWGAERNRRDYFTTSDEPDHVKACRELRSGPGVVSNFEHPVLMKVLGAAGLPSRPLDRRDDEVRAARRAFPWAFGLLAFVSGLWALKRSGPLAGLCVAALVAAEPTLRGHAPLVHTDLLLTTLLLTAAACLDLSGDPRRPRLAPLVGSGVAYGLALTAKYSALPFLVVFLAAAVVRLHGLRPSPAPEPAPKRKRRRQDSPVPATGPSWGTAARRAFVLVAVPALVTAALVQNVVVASTTTRQELVRGVHRKFRGYPYHEEALRAAATLPRGFAAYAAGLLWVRASSVPGARINYFLGEVSGTGWFLYFPVALALKLTATVVLGLLAAAIATATVLARRGTAGRRRRLRVLAARGLLPFFLGAAYLGAAMVSNVNIGVRHAVPSVPLFLVAAAAVLRTTVRRRVRVVIGPAVVALAVLEAAPYLGREIPFGNLLAGGPAGVRRVLSDSNVDWGERLGEVFRRASKGDLGRVGVASLFWDEQAASEAGVAWVDEFAPGSLDTLFVSVFLWDLGPAVERSSESFPKIADLRDWFSPAIRTIRQEAVSMEPFGDEYLLIRLRPGVAPPDPRR